MPFDSSRTGRARARSARALVGQGKQDADLSHDGGGHPTKPRTGSRKRRQQWQLQIGGHRAGEGALQEVQRQELPSSHQLDGQQAKQQSRYLLKSRQQDKQQHEQQQRALQQEQAQAQAQDHQQPDDIQQPSGPSAVAPPPLQHRVPRFQVPFKGATQGVPNHAAPSSGPVFKVAGLRKPYRKIGD